MTKRSRYLIIFFGFIFFLILAPIIVLYVRGISYDFTTRGFVHTGILAVKADPKNVSIYLNNKLARSGSGDINFLRPDEYQITLKSPEYQDWNKRLGIDAGQVTWANPQNNSIYLFYSKPAITKQDEKVLDFFGDPSNFLYLTSLNATLKTNGYLGQTKTFKLPQNVDKILAADSGNKYFFLGSGSSLTTLLYLNSYSAGVIDLSNLFTEQPKIMFFGSNIIALSGGNLYQINPDTKTKKLLLKSVTAFYPQGSNLYYIQLNNGVYSLNVIADTFDQNQVLLTGLQKFDKQDLFVNFNKQIFLLADGSLYQDLGDMEKVADNVSQTNFDVQDSNFAVFHSGEYDYLDFFGSGLNFITRTGQNIYNLQIKNNIDYAFYAADNKINAIELDARDSQNQYTLYTGQNIQKFSLDSYGQNILVLDDGELKTVKIR